MPIGRLIETARAHRRPVALAAWRTAETVVRRRIPSLASPAVRLGHYDARVIADLHQPTGLGLMRYGFSDPVAWAVDRLLGPGDCFLDGGANIGTMSLVGAARVGPTGAVISCEPSPATVQALERNIALNRFTWITVEQVALADESGHAEFVDFGYGAGLSSFAPGEPERGRRRRVTLMRIDDLVARASVTPAVVKLDVEGAEVKALRGARRLLAERRACFIVEVEPGHLQRQGATVEDLRALLAGYRAYAITRRAAGFALAAWDGPWEAQANLVLIPEGREALRPR